MKRVLVMGGVALGVSLMTGGVLLAYQGSSTNDNRVVIPQLQRETEETPPQSTEHPPGHNPPRGVAGPRGLDPGEEPLEGGVVRFTFDGTPATPEPYYWIDGWDVQVHSRDAETWEQLETIHAQHGPACEPPTMTHEVSDYEAAVFRCRDHLMTAINAGGYGMIYLTPPYMADFSGGEAVIRFNLSTLALSTRDWWDVWLTPWDSNQALPLEDWLPDAQGEPRDAVHVKLNDHLQVCARVVRNHQEVVAPECDSTPGYDSVLTPDPARRDTFEIRISKNRLRVGMPDYDLWWEDLRINLDWDQAVVQFGHHSYNPTKDGAGEPNTWHWDTFEIAPAKPFTIIRAQQRVANDSDTITFDAPAPANAMLRFAAIGTVEVSVDQGESWSLAQRQQEEGRHAEHFSSYWMPIPEGIDQVLFRFSDDDWYTGPFLARDITIWAPSR